MLLRLRYFAGDGQICAGTDLVIDGGLDHQMVIKGHVHCTLFEFEFGIHSDHITTIRIHDQGGADVHTIGIHTSQIMRVKQSLLFEERKERRRERDREGEG